MIVILPAAVADVITGNTLQAFWRALNSVFGDKIQFKTTLKGASMLMNSAFRDLWVPGLCFFLLFATMLAGLIQLFTGLFLLLMHSNLHHLPFLTAMDTCSVDTVNCHRTADKSAHVPSSCIEASTCCSQKCQLVGIANCLDTTLYIDCCVCVCVCAPFPVMR